MSLSILDGPVSASEPPVRNSLHLQPLSAIPRAARSPLPVIAMASTTTGDDEYQYSCKCLNVRIQPMATETMATELIEDADYTQVFVGEEGIVIVSVIALKKYLA